MNIRGLSQEVVSWYLSHVDETSPHAENIARLFRGPVIALTVDILNSDAPDLCLPSLAEDESETPAAEEAKGRSNNNGSDWKSYLQKLSNDGSVPEFTDKDPEGYDELPKRAKDRLSAFLEGVSLAVPSADDSRKKSNESSAQKDLASRQQQYVESSKGEFGTSNLSFSLVEGLAGFRSMERGRSSLQVLRTISMSSSKSSVITKRPQMSERDLVTRLELYLRSLYRVKSLGRDCVVDAEPVRAVKARADNITCAFVDTVSTVRQQGPVLTRLLTTSTKELLATDVISGELMRVIRRMVSEYEQKTSFASLAFLSSPENSASHLTPMVLRFLRYLRSNWKRCEADCDLERMLCRCLDPKVRHTFKTVEFRSIGHLLEVCHHYRSELQHIEFPPTTLVGPDRESDGSAQEDEKHVSVDEGAVQQALRDLQREVITVNGHVLPPVTSRSELIRLLSQTLSSSSLTAKVNRKSRRRRRKNMKREDSGISELSDDSFSFMSSGNEGDISVDGSPTPRRHVVVPDGSPTRGSVGRNRSFRLSTVDFLTKRLLLAGSRTGTGGDAFFVVRDLFGGEDVEVVQSSTLRSQRRETIEIIVRLASVTIRCHGSFDVYPKSLVGSCEPLIQVHTTTSETIGLQEVRAVDTNGTAKKMTYDSDDDKGPVMVVQERKTDRSGWRTLSIRPALYEKVEDWNTPS